MDENQDPVDEGNSVIAGPKAEPFRLRSYQAEMVEESLNNNIIVAMDTGSGKTHMYVILPLIKSPFPDICQSTRTHRCRIRDLSPPSGK